MAATDTAERTLNSALLTKIISLMKNLIPDKLKDLSDGGDVVLKSATTDQSIASNITMSKDVHVGGKLYLSDGSYIYIQK